MITHRALDGSWALCPDAETCGLLFHFPGQTPAEMAAVPDLVLYELLGVVQPPTDVFSGVQLWTDTQGRAHRDYDLPAVIRTDGSMAWMRKDVRHRDGERPAIVGADGLREWWIEGMDLIVETALGGPYQLHEVWYSRELPVFPAGRLAGFYDARLREQQRLLEGSNGLGAT